MPISLSDIIITEELKGRPAKERDYLKEKLALQELASQMADNPGALLPRLVDLALEFTGGVAAGLSLYEDTPAPGVFRWKHLKGLLASFDGATTPRDFSPCGVTLDRNAPVLIRHPEQFYDWIAEANLVLSEVLLVPLHMGGQIPIGTIWIVGAKSGHFDSGHARTMTDLASFVGIALRMVHTEERLQTALAQQELLTREMGHRVKNVFAMTESMVRLSARGAESAGELAQAVLGRLRALQAAHSIVHRNFAGTEGALETPEFSDILEAIISPHNAPSEAGQPRFTLRGPSILCGEATIRGMALVFHELATNAAKYGAVSECNGHVDIDWRIEDDRLVLQWMESGGPAIVSPPVETGFGSTLVQNTILRQFNGTLVSNWQRDGLSVTMIVPVKALAD